MPIPDIPEQFNAVEAFIDKHLAAGRGDRVALCWNDQTVTYAQLAANVNRVGNVFLRLGIRPEERVLLAVLDSPEFVYSFWGALKIGAVPVPVNTFLCTDEYAYLLENSRASAFVVAQEVWPTVASLSTPRLRSRIVVGNGGQDALSFWTLIEKESATLEPELTDRDDMALWLYSSGSTGTPKGVIHLHRDLLYCAETYAKEVLGIGPGDVTFSASRLFFSYGLGGGLTFALHAGATAALVSARPTPEGVYATIHRYRPTIFFGVPTLYAALLQMKGIEQKYDLSSLRLCVSAGEALPAELFKQWRERFGIEILDGIGSTEMLHIFVSSVPGKCKPGSCGFPVPGYEVKITGEKGEPSGEGEIGNLQVRGASAFAEYWRIPELTAQTKHGDWIVTGDKFFCDSDGYYHYCGRADDMLKVAGMWVSPMEVENALLGHPQVAEAAVVGATDERGLSYAVAHVVLRGNIPGSEKLAAEICEHVKARLVSYKVPREVRFCGELPKTVTGKIQRFKLRGG